VKSSGGHIVVESELNEGSVFKILFPPVSGVLNKSSDKTLTSTPQASTENKEILIVDDEPSLGIFLGEIVSNYGYGKMIFTSSTEALTLFKKEPDRFSLVITDQTMPNLTGIDLITQLRILKPDFPAILCSGYSDKINENEAEDLNISFFQKPVDTKALISRIDQLIK
ncbi:MAG: response regulator, partial [Gammaproteobacteria bacterium]|nr:response regulator [Gammaproteobacteria bacterium]